MSAPRSDVMLLHVLLPNGDTETIRVGASDRGISVLTKMLPMKKRHSLPEDLQIFRPDGNALEFNVPLRQQGLRDGSQLNVGELSHVSKQMDEHGEIKEHGVYAFGTDEVNFEDEAQRVRMLPRHEREKRAKGMKDGANAELKAGRALEARNLYSMGLKILPPGDSDSVLVSALFGNRALANLKMKDWTAARGDAEQSLQLQSGNAKVMYRLAVANRELEDFGKARQLLEEVLALPGGENNREARTALAELEAEVRKAEEKKSLAPEPDVPELLHWSMSQSQQGYRMDQVSRIWQQLDAEMPVELSDGQASVLRHVLRHQQPLEMFFRTCLAAVSGRAGWQNSAIALLLGAGSCVAAPLLSRLVASGALLKATVVEPSVRMSHYCRQLASKAKFVEVEGQLNSEFVIPAAAFEQPAHVFAMLPGNIIEPLAVEPSDTGLALLMRMMPLKKRHQLPEDLEILTPMGVPLRMGCELREQGVVGGSVLRVCSKVDLGSADSENRTVEDAAIEGRTDNAASTPVLVVCDRLCDNLLGERLVPTMAAGLAAARRNLPKGCEVQCVPSRAVLFCAPLELRCCSMAGWDTSKANAMRFCAAEGFGQASMASEQHVSGWWPLDLDEEFSRTDTCRLCGLAQPVAEFDFDNQETFMQQSRVTTRVVSMLIRGQCRVNALAVWWQIEGPGNAFLSTEPGIANDAAARWPGKRQAVYYLGYEIGFSEEEELLSFRMVCCEQFTQLRFELLSPQLVERMGLSKFQLRLTDLTGVQQLRAALNMDTCRAQVPSYIAEMQLEVGDRLTMLGPLDVTPGLLTDRVWTILENRFTDVQPDEDGVECCFARCQFEGTCRWPPPNMIATATVPRLPGYFDFFHSQQHSWYLTTMTAMMQRVGMPKPRVLEIGCGPVPLLSLCAARQGARVWAVEMEPSLRELALGTVRDSNLEMVSRAPGGTNFAFFGKPRQPEDPSVRVLRAMPSTSLQPGPGAPRLLDGERAHIVVCAPSSDVPLSEDFLLTMRSAAADLLEPGGMLVPSSLAIRAVPVQWSSLGAAREALHVHLCSGRTAQVARSDNILPLCHRACTVVRLDLATALEIPATGCSVRFDVAGTFSAVAYWHEPASGDDDRPSDGDGGMPPNATVWFLPRPRHVAVGESVSLVAAFEHRRLVVCERVVDSDPEVE